MTASGRICTKCCTGMPAEGSCPSCGADMPVAHDVGHALTAGTILDGRYEVGQALGAGGFGITYVGRDRRFGRLLAIKEYFPVGTAARAPDGSTVRPFSGKPGEWYADGLRKSVLEGTKLAQFDHPAIVKVHDFVEGNNTSYLIMEFVDGMNLEDYVLSRGGRLSFVDATAIVERIVGALDVVHRAGLIHRDISPDNVMVTEDGHLKLLDFGAARHAVSEQSQNMTVMVKVGYAPWEQYQTKGRQGPYTDLYALGGLLYRCVVGQRPIDAPMRIPEDTLVPPSEAGIHLVPVTEAFLRKAMAIHAGDRFQTADDFRQGLLAAHAAESAAALRPGSGGQGSGGQGSGNVVSGRVGSGRGPRPDARPQLPPVPSRSGPPEPSRDAWEEPSGRGVGRAVIIVLVMIAVTLVTIPVVAIAVSMLMQG